jgi:hypothetical protein
MAQAFHGRAGKVKAGTNLIGSVTAWSYEESVDEQETTAMGDVAKTYLGGLRDGSGQVDCWWLKTDVGHAALLAAFASGQAVELTILPTGLDTTGEIEFSGPVVVKSRSLDGSKDDIIKVSFAFRGFLEQTVL